MFEQIITVIYLRIILFVMHEKHIPREAYFQPPLKIYELFRK